MGLHFVPSRSLMAREIDQCIALNKLTPLLTLCNSCAVRASSDRFENECRNCKVLEGIVLISKRRQIDEPETAAPI